MPLFEDYRPATWASFIGNDKAKAKAQAQAICKRAKSTGKPFAIWIDGPSGTGKTTLAHLIAVELEADKAFDVIELDGPACDGRAVSDLQSRLALKSWGKGFRVCIVNESHSMTDKGVQFWLTLLERLGPKTAIVFSTTEGRKAKDGKLFGNFGDALKSRCIPLSLSNQGLADSFALEAKRIAELEGLGGAELKEYVALVKKHRNNFRAVLSEIDGFELYRDNAETAPKAA